MRKRSDDLTRPENLSGIPRKRRLLPENTEGYFVAAWSFPTKNPEKIPGYLYAKAHAGLIFQNSKELWYGKKFLFRDGLFMGDAIEMFEDGLEAIGGSEYKYIADFHKLKNRKIDGLDVYVFGTER